MVPPILLTTHGDQAENQTFYKLSENRHNTTHVPNLRDKAVLGSSDGWLLLVDQSSEGSGECCLWNPTSSPQTIHLPDLDHPRHYNRCFLSKPPTDPDCFILLNSPRSIDQILYRFQDNSLFEFDFVQLGYMLMSVVSFRGTIYGIRRPLRTSKHELVTVDVVGNKFETKPLWEVPRLARSCHLFNLVYLMESPCGNELLLVTKMAFNADLDCTMHFRVFRVDVDRMECEELDNLDGLTVFISNYGNGFCRSSQSLGPTIKSNSIYYTNEGCVLVNVYDLDDMSTTTFLPCPDADIDVYTAESYWVDLSELAMENCLRFRVS